MGAEGVSDYATRLQAFIEAHAPLRVMARPEKRSPTIGMEDGIYYDWAPEVRTEKGERCDACGYWRLKRRTPLLGRDGKVQMVGLDCWDSLNDFGHIIYERPSPPPEELKYVAR